LIPSKTDMNLLQAARKPLELLDACGGNTNDDEDDDIHAHDVMNSGVEFEVKILRSQDFKYEYAKQRMLSFLHQLKNRMVDVGNHLNQIDSGDHGQMVRAGGALIQFMQTNRLLFGELDGDLVFKMITKISSLSFSGFMQVDMSTLKSLGVFHIERHPSMARKIGVSKEGHSLFGILNKTKSKIGRDLLRQWFLQPLMDVEEINQRMNGVQFFSQPYNTELTNELRDSLKHMKNTKAMLKRIKEVKASVNDWSNLYKTLYCFKTIYELCSVDDNLLSQVPAIHRLVKAMNQDILGNLQVMSTAIDFKESKAVNRIVILPGIDEELDEKKETYNGLDRFLSLVADQEAGLLPDDFPPFNIVYYPQLGYLIAIQRTETNETSPEILGVEFSFMSSECLYYKNKTMHDLDEEVGDVHGQILEIESCIVRNIEKYVLNSSESVARVSEVCAELDCLISLAIVAKENCYVRPSITKSNHLEIEQGRHPLQELTVSTFIPNDTHIVISPPSSSKKQHYLNLMDDENANDHDEQEDISSDRVNLITGANNSGKTVYLKQVGLIVYMAHIGSFVPAQRAVIGLTDQIMTRIQSHDSVSVHQSTFAVDLLQMNHMTTACTERSLLLIDEFGKGTLALDGLSLLASTLSYLVQMKDKCPRVFVSTHYTELLEYQLINWEPVSSNKTGTQSIDSNLRVKFWTMDAVVQHNGKDVNVHDDDNEEVTDEKQLSNEIDADDIVFLYKLVPGRITPSYGILCAQMAGVPKEILNRARYVSHQMRHNQPVQKLESANDQWRHERDMEIVRRFNRLNCEQPDQVEEFLTYLRTMTTTDEGATNTELRSGRAISKEHNNP